MKHNLLILLLLCGCAGTRQELVTFIMVDKVKTTDGGKLEVKAKAKIDSENKEFVLQVSPEIESSAIVTTDGQEVRVNKEYLIKHLEDPSKYPLVVIYDQGKFSVSTDIHLLDKKKVTTPVSPEVVKEKLTENILPSNLPKTYEFNMLSVYGQDNGVSIDETVNAPEGYFASPGDITFHIRRTLGKDDPKPIINTSPDGKSIRVKCSTRHGPWIDKWRSYLTVVVNVNWKKIVQ